jgi:hypothetical protein
VYVKVDRVRSGKKVYSYLTLAESYRNESGQPRHRVVARLGEVSELKSSGQLERIVEALSVQLGCGASIELTAESAPSYGAMAGCDALGRRSDPHQGRPRLPESVGGMARHGPRDADHRVAKLSQFSG